MTRLLIALSAALLAVIFTLLPVEQQMTEYTWEPATDGPHVPLLLLERTPDELDLRFPCALTDAGTRQLFVSSRSPESVPALFVYAGESRVVAEVRSTSTIGTSGRRGYAAAATRPPTSRSADNAGGRKESRSAPVATRSGPMCKRMSAS